jgi:hypothetical protein
MQRLAARRLHPFVGRQAKLLPVEVFLAVLLMAVFPDHRSLRGEPALRRELRRVPGRGLLFAHFGHTFGSFIFSGAFIG